MCWCEWHGCPYMYLHTSLPSSSLEQLRKQVRCACHNRYEHQRENPHWTPKHNLLLRSFLKGLNVMRKQAVEWLIPDDEEGILHAWPPLSSSTSPSSSVHIPALWISVEAGQWVQGDSISLCLGFWCIDSIKAKQCAGYLQHSLGHLLSDL